MPHYEFFCHNCIRPFSKTLVPIEQKEGQKPSRLRLGGRDARKKAERISR
jgi:hypothetical protein